MGGVLIRDQRSHHCHGPSKATILLHLHFPPTSPPCCHGELALCVDEPESPCAAPCEGMGWREWRKGSHLVKLFRHPHTWLETPKKDAALCVVLHKLAVREEGPGTERAGVAATALLCLDVQMLVCWLPWLPSPPDGHTSHKTGAGWTQERVWTSEVQQAFTEHSLRPGGRPIVDKGRSSSPPEVWSTRC